jgi:hypothetical protein
MATAYYIVKGGKYLVEYPKGKYGMQFDSYKDMRMAIKSEHKLKKRKSEPTRLWGWSHLYTGKKIVRWGKGGKFIEMYPETIKGKRRWFIDVISKDKIKSGEFSTKAKAEKYLENYMRRY